VRFDPPLVHQQPGRNAAPNNTLKHPPKYIAGAEAIMPRTGEIRMIRNLVLNAQAAEPAIGQVFYVL
jgi:hypothetical protein